MKIIHKKDTILGYKVGDCVRSINVKKKTGVKKLRCYKIEGFNKDWRKEGKKIIYLRESKDRFHADLIMIDLTNPKHIFNWVSNKKFLQTLKEAGISPGNFR